MSSINHSPNQALQRTRSAVTLAASCRRLCFASLTPSGLPSAGCLASLGSPAMQPARQLRESLSFGSLDHSERMKITEANKRYGFFEPELLVAVATLAILAAVGMRLIATYSAYWWLIILVAAAIWLLVLYGLRLIGSSRFSRRRPPKHIKTDTDDHLA